MRAMSAKILPLIAMQHHSLCQGCTVPAAGISEQEGACGAQLWGRTGHGARAAPLEESWHERVWRLK